MSDDNDWIEGAQLKGKVLTRLLESIDEEIGLMTANAKFNFTIRKTDENYHKIVLAYIDDTKKIVGLLKARMSLLSEAKS